MSDKTLVVGDQITKTFRDEGGGSFAEVVDLANSSSRFPSATLALRANATAYVLGKIIAQSATAAQCSGVALAAARLNGGTGFIDRIRLKIDDAAWLNAQLRVHCFKNNPTFAQGDGQNFAGNLSESAWLGSFDVTLNQSFSDPFVKGIGTPTDGQRINFDAAASTQSIYWGLEARSTVTASNAIKTFTLLAEIFPS